MDAYRTIARVKTALKREGYIGVETAFQNPELKAAVVGVLKAQRPS